MMMSSTFVESHLGGTISDLEKALVGADATVRKLIAIGTIINSLLSA